MGLAPILVNWASWGISDDKFVWVANSFQEVQGLEVRNNPKSLKLQYALTKDSWTTVDEISYCMCSDHLTFVVAFGASGWVYVRSNLWWTGTWSKNVYTFATAVLDAAIFTVSGNIFLWMATATKMYIINIVYVLTADWTANVIDKSSVAPTVALTSSVPHPMLVRPEWLYIGNGNSVTYIDPLWAVTYKALDISATNETVRAITDNGTMIRVYSNSKLYFFTATAIAPQETQNLDVDFNGVAKRNSVDYMIWSSGWLVSDKSRIYYYPYQRTLLKIISGIAIYQNVYESYRENILIWGTAWVYAWWALNKNYPESLTLEYIPSDTANLSSTTCVYKAWTNLFVASRRSGTTLPRIDKLSTTTYTTSGFVTTRVYYSDMMLAQKDSIERYLAVKKLTGANQIKLYTKYDGTSNFTLEYTCTASTHPNPYIKIPIRWVWNYMELKIELIGNGSDTPEIYESYFKFSQRGI